jgi:hypothetical protein
VSPRLARRVLADKGILQSSHPFMYCWCWLRRHRWSIRFSFSAVDWASMHREARMVEEQPLRAAQAARELGIPTKELLRLVYERKIRYVMGDGIAHVPIDAVEEYRSKAS